jgi:hypothetical protein
MIPIPSLLSKILSSLCSEGLEMMGWGDGFAPVSRGKVDDDWDGGEGGG